MEKCPLCGKSKLIRKITSQEYSYKGYSFFIEGVEMMWCDVCNEGILNHEMVQKVEVEVKKQHKLIDEITKK